MARAPGDAEYSIAAVSKLTGVSCHALRVWERRYGFPVPHRTASGHRRYSREQVQLLRRISDLSQSGHPIGDLIAGVREGRLEGESFPSPVVPARVDLRAAELVDRLLQGDLAGGEVCFQRLAETYDATELVTRVLEPAFVDMGERWFRRECEVFQERIASGFLRSKLEILINEARRSNNKPARTIVIGTVQGDRHAGGALMLNLFLEHAGWRVLNLGVDLPVREYQKAVAVWKPDAMALSFVLSRNINKRFQELSQIRSLPVFVGGRSILNYQGLARRYGLIPIAGPMASAINLFFGEYEIWPRKGSSEPAQ
jgi:MerR family transcriptional regulator, light-induced transcriptional regulator